ncbi:MAG: hypothetical protein R3C45_17015 [Phycisphaerales bacterium]
MAGPDYIVEINGVRVPDAQRHASGGFRDRPWLAVQWKCCGVYSRIYRNKQGTLYEGRCPRCSRQVSARVGPGGTTSRFFKAQ